MDHYDKNEIDQSIRRIEKLLGCGIFLSENAGHVLLRAAFIELLIALRDLMYKCGKHATPISFADDVAVDEKVRDVSGLIKFVRDALCHPDSDNHFIEPGGTKASFNVMFGKGCLLKMGDFEQSSPYEDDVCFFFGSRRIYLNRHIIRAFEEAKAALVPLIQGEEV